MKNLIKQLLRKVLIALRWDITKNIEYDRLTSSILKKQLTSTSNCIDVGCHKGEILDAIIQLAPDGIHYGFEPIPHLFKGLQKKYTSSNLHLYNCALSDKEGRTTFNFVKSAPAYSGIKQRAYEEANPDIEVIEVDLKRLDAIIPENGTIDLIKIDVEGAEMGVLLGAYAILKKQSPILIFESGIGASDYYGTTPEMIYDYIVQELHYSLYTLKSFLKNDKGLALSEFTKIYQEKSDYYFVAKKDK